MAQHVRGDVISIHALREEGDPWPGSCGPQKFISIHALREEGDGRRPEWSPAPPISIHALHEEGDFRDRPARTLSLIISIHALREEGDFSFLSGAARRGYFYPRPPRGGRPEKTPEILLHNNFYPRPPRGGRRSWCAMWWTWTNFYPRPPRGGRREAAGVCAVQLLISIHALREEGDQSQPVADACPPISIHALREEGDGPSLRPEILFRHFYPRPPRGGRRQGIQIHPPSLLISIHALREEGDIPPCQALDLRYISIHALREEGDSKCDGQMKI